jgi:hypothetical protein
MPGLPIKPLWFLNTHLMAISDGSRQRRASMNEASTWLHFDPLFSHHCRQPFGSMERKLLIGDYQTLL